MNVSGLVALRVYGDLIVKSTVLLTFFTLIIN